jgi:hypothetical protein
VTKNERPVPAQSLNAAAASQAKEQTHTNISPTRDQNRKMRAISSSLHAAFTDAAARALRTWPVA